MGKIRLSIENEFDRLTHVVLGTGRGYHRDRSLVEIVNETQKETFESGAYPTETSLACEFNNFKQALNMFDVYVYEPVIAPDAVQDQTCPRDIGFVIGDVFVVSAMHNKSRKQEIAGISEFFECWEGTVLEAPANISLEGGDVIIDDGCIFVGIGQRSNQAGFEYMRAMFDDKYDIIPMPCKSSAQGENILHLDCAFQPLGLGHALIYPDGFETIPSMVCEKYTLLQVNKEEANALATNVMSIQPDVIIARTATQCMRVNRKLRNSGYRVIEVKFDLVPSTGGSFRCVTLPIRRG